MHDIGGSTLDDGLLVVGSVVEWAGVMVGPWLHRRQEEAHEAGY